MDFKIYNQHQVISDNELTGYLFNTIIDNLSYLFGDDMGADENKNEWIKHNLKDENQYWRVIIGSKNDQNLGFIVYTIKNRCLSINDIEINKSDRFNPVLILGLFKKLFKAENSSFDTISGYINKNNQTSISNFLKYSTSITERQRGYSFVIDEMTTDKIKSKVIKWSGA